MQVKCPLHVRRRVLAVCCISLAEHGACLLFVEVCSLNQQQCLVVTAAKLNV